MKRYSGDLLAILGKKQKEAAALRNNAYEVQMIDAHDIIPNSKNFYGIREVEELATRMKISGHITPLEVVARDDEPGKYTLISGERRRAAMLYRLEQGEIEKAVMPCIVRVDLDDTEALTAEEVETINIICANDYRDKTPFEKLDEVQKLKPIARKCWEKEKNRPENFRMYFAKSFLGISPSSLQRITVLEKLVPEARSAYEEELISFTALSELAYKTEEEQRSYIAELRAGERSGTIEDVTEKVKRKEADSDAVEGRDVEIDTQGEVRNTGDVFEQPEDADKGNKVPVEKAGKNEAPEPLESIDMTKAEAEARLWVKEGLQRLVEEATGKMEAAKAKEDSTNAALWDLRRAAANLAIEAMICA